MEKQEVAVQGAYERLKVQPYEHRTRYYETYQMGVIYQTNYMKWLEDARMDLLSQLGFGYKQMEELQIICPLLTETINYISMVRFDETVTIETKLTRYDGKKMTLDYTIYDKETQDIKATAKSTHCFMNRSGIPISLNRVYPELETRFIEFK